MISINLKRSSDLSSNRMHWNGSIRLFKSHKIQFISSTLTFSKHWLLCHLQCTCWNYWHCLYQELVSLWVKITYCTKEKKKDNNKRQTNGNKMQALCECRLSILDNRNTFVSSFVFFLISIKWAVVDSLELIKLFWNTTEVSIHTLFKCCTMTSTCEPICLHSAQYMYVHRYIRISNTEHNRTKPTRNSK